MDSQDFFKNLDEIDSIVARGENVRSIVGELQKRGAEEARDCIMTPECERFIMSKSTRFATEAEQIACLIGAGLGLGFYGRILKQALTEKFVPPPEVEELERVCQLALNAFEKNWCIDWNELTIALEKYRSLKGG